MASERFESPTVNAQHAKTLIANLIEAGVRYYVVSPGSRNTPLSVAIAEAVSVDARLSLEIVVDERSAGFFALGLARQSRTPAVLVCTSGSAAVHYFPACVEASESNVPLIVLTADRPPEAQFSGDWQTINQSNLFGQFARHFEDLGVPGEFNSLTRVAQTATRIVSIARGDLGRPGPVQLNCPFRKILWAEESAQTDFTPPIFKLTQTERVTQKLPETLLENILSTKKLIVCVGEIDEHTELEQISFFKLLSQLAKEFNWPVLVEGISGLRYGDYDFARICHYDPVLRSAELAAKLKPDLILRFGRTPCHRPLRDWLIDCAKRTIAVSAYRQFFDPGHALRQLVLARPLDLIAGINEHKTDIELSQRHGDLEFFSAWLNAESEVSAIVDQYCDILDSGPELQATLDWEGAIFRHLIPSLPSASLLHVANSMPIRDLDSFGGGRSAPIHLMQSRGANGIDGTIATAFGETIAHSNSGALVIGDLAFWHDIGSLELLMRHDVSFKVFVINNNGGGIFGFLPISKHPSHFDQLFVTRQKRCIESVVKAHNLSFKRIKTVAELQRAASTPCPRPHIFEICVDRGTNLATHKAVIQEAQEKLTQSVKL